MDDEKRGQLISLAVRRNARQAIEKVQYRNRQKRLADALAVTRGCIVAIHELSPEVTTEMVKFTDVYIGILRGCVRAMGGGDLEITATFPEGKITIDKFSQ
jgi:hypothetical protein